MRRPNNAKLRSRSAQLSSSDAPTSPVPRKSPRWNATKHGLRSKSTLQPGDDAAEFHERRREALHTYRPRTGAERRCVDAMVRLEWKIERYERWQEIYEAKHEAVVGDGNGPHCESDPHRWMHRAMDCTVQAQRMDRHLARLERRLEGLQQLRRQNFAERLAELEAQEEPLLPEGLGIEEPGAAPSDAPPEDTVPEDLGPESAAAEMQVPAARRVVLRVPRAYERYATTRSRNRRIPKAGKRLRRSGLYALVRRRRVARSG